MPTSARVAGFLHDFTVVARDDVGIVPYGEKHSKYSPVSRKAP